MKYELNDVVTIEVSGESGKIIGRAEYANGAPPSYLIRMKDPQGRAVETWQTEDALTA